jgi:hypothetical protein
VGVHASYEKIADSWGWQELLQLPGLTGMIMFISSASSFYLLSLLNTIQDRYDGSCMAVDSQYATKWAPLSYP